MVQLAFMPGCFLVRIIGEAVAAGANNALHFGAEGLPNVIEDSLATAVLRRIVEEGCDGFVFSGAKG